MRVLIAGGGTAGHVEPALSLAEQLRQRGHDVWLLGTPAGAEARLVPQRDFPLLEIEKVPFPRRLNLQLLTFIPKQLRVLLTTRRHMLRNNIDVVVGFGGYVAWPAYVAARLMHRVMVVFSYDARPGIANRIAARWTNWLGVGVHDAHGVFARARYTGVPLRQAIISLDRVQSRTRAADTLGLDTNRKTLVVFGGSLGAVRINAALLDCADAITGTGWQVLHITGSRNESDLSASLKKESSGQWRALGYLDDMASAYALADLVVSRSGAVTCAELTATGVPAVLVPYAVGNGEQTLNAESLLKSGGYRLVADVELDGERLWRELQPLLMGSDLEAMNDNAMRWSAQQRTADAAHALATLVEEAAQHGR